MNLKLELQRKPSANRVLYVLIGVFILVLTLALVVSYTNAQRAARERLQQQAKQLEPPTESAKRHVKRVLLKRTNEDGTVEYVEIFSRGQINRYDANMNLLKTGLLGLSTVRDLFDAINQGLDDWQSLIGGKGNYEITIDTNKGSTTIVVTDQDGDDEGVLDDIIDDIEDLEDKTLDPTPTIPQTVTLPPSFFSPTPEPGLTPGAEGGNPTPTVGPGTPSPLPEYLTKPPFECEEVYAGGKPLPVSNTLCGFDPETPR